MSPDLIRTFFFFTLILSFLYIGAFRAATGASFELTVTTILVSLMMFFVSAWRLRRDQE